MDDLVIILGLIGIVASIGLHYERRKPPDSED
jgi:hypothetical protein